MLDKFRARVWSIWLRTWLRIATRIWVILLYSEAGWAYLRGRIPSFWHIGPAVAARVKMASDQMNQGRITPTERRIMEKAIAKRNRRGGNLKEIIEKRKATLTTAAPRDKLAPSDSEEG